MRRADSVLLNLISLAVLAGCVTPKSEEPIPSDESVSLKCQSKDICLEAALVPAAVIDKLKAKCAELKGDFVLNQSCIKDKSAGSCQYREVTELSPLKPIDAKNKDLALLNLKENDALMGSRLGLKYFFYLPMYNAEYVEKFCAKKSLVYIKSL